MVLFSHENKGSPDPWDSMDGLETFVLGEGSLSWKAAHCVIPFIRNVQNRLIDRDNKIGSCQGLAVGGYRDRMLIGMGLFWGGVDKNILELYSNGGCTTWKLC